MAPYPTIKEIQTAAVLSHNIMSENAANADLLPIKPVLCSASMTIVRIKFKLHRHPFSPQKKQPCFGHFRKQELLFLPSIFTPQSTQFFSIFPAHSEVRRLHRSAARSDLWYTKLPSNQAPEVRTIRWRSRHGRPPLRFR